MVFVWTDLPPGPQAEGTLVGVVKAKDFSLASFNVAISRIQQAALDQASAKVPCPEDQLALLRAKRAAKVKETNLSSDC